MKRIRNTNYPKFEVVEIDDKKSIFRRNPLTEIVIKIDCKNRERLTKLVRNFDSFKLVPGNRK